MSSHPRLRTDLEFIPVQHEGKPFVLVRDPLGLVKEGQALPAELFQLMACLDGKHSLRDLQMLLMRRQGGVLVGTQEVERLLGQLDEAFLLDGPRYQEERRKLRSAFAAQRVRPCVQCGRAYPAERDALAQALDRLLETGGDPPGLPGEPVAVIAPHIDLSVGGPAYARAYACLGGRTFSRVIVLGVGHQLQEGFFSLTEKDFETPLGRARNDRRAVQDLAQAGRNLLAPDDFAHRHEHSIEFQLILLQHVLARPDFALLPVLCGPAGAILPRPSRRAYLDRAGLLLKALAALARDPARPTLIVVGVDLSHIGPKFGHPEPAAALEADARGHDQALLEAVEKRDSEALWEIHASSGDRYNVCGFSALACLLEILPEAEAVGLDYRLWHEAATRSAVAFAAMVFTRPA